VKHILYQGQSGGMAGQFLQCLQSCAIPITSVIHTNLLLSSLMAKARMETDQE